MRFDVGADADAGERAWRRFSRAAAVAAAAALVAGLAVTVAVDPFWVFRADPPWLVWTGGVNRHLDLEMRRAKPLQLFARPAGTVLIGSSVVYRGLRPADVGGPAYNLGLSSLMADELPVVAALAAERGAARVLIGLDYYMFSGLAGPPRLDPDLARPLGRAAARIRAALSWRALAGSWPAVIRDAPEGGAWRADGFKTTPDYPAAVTRRIAAEQDFAAMRYRPDTLRHLEAALVRLRGTDLRVYLSPVSAHQLAAADKAGRRQDMESWRADVVALGLRAGIAVQDLTTGHPFSEFDPERGSSRFWFDNLHFRPEVGAWVVRRAISGRMISGGAG